MINHYYACGKKAGAQNSVRLRQNRAPVALKMLYTSSSDNVETSTNDRHYVDRYPDLKAVCG